MGVSRGQLRERKRSVREMLLTRRYTQVALLETRKFPARLEFKIWMLP